MSKLLTAIKKGVYAAVTLSVITAGIVVGAVKVGATYTQVPQAAFNYMGDPNDPSHSDYELIQLRKQGDTNWGDPITATAGDRIEVLVYYHNGGQQTATNTKVKVNLPTTFGSSLVMDGSIDSDQTTPITDTTSGYQGPIYGKSGGTVNVTGTQSRMDVIPDSAIWYMPDTQGNVVPGNLPGGQTTMDIVSGNGVNIGDVQGCWIYAGFIYFQVQLTAGNPGYYTEKWGAVSGDSTWYKTFTTQPANFLAYRVYYNNTGTSTATNVKVVDPIPAHTTYAPGTAYWRTKDAQDNDVDTPIPDSKITKNGNTLTFPFSSYNTSGDVVPGDRNSFFLVFQVKLDDASQFNVGTTQLTNQATITSTNGLNALTDQVITNVYRAPTPTITFRVDKTTDNSSIGNANDPWVDFTSAAPGDFVAFKIDVINEGNTDATNVLVTDALPQYFNYVNGTTKIYYLGNAGGTALSDGITAGGLTIDVPAGNQNMRTIVFQTQVDASAPTGTTTLVNTGNVPAGSNNGTSWVLASDTATVQVSTSRDLTISKLAKTTGGWVENVSAEEGDTVYFQINVFNNGSGKLDQVHVWDVLPQYMTYIPNSTYIDGVWASDGITGNGLILTDLTPGMGKIIEFAAKVVPCPQIGDYDLTNEAKVIATDVSQKQDTASVHISVVRPNLPPVMP